MSDNLLKEDGDLFELEDGTGFLLLEEPPPPPPPSYAGWRVGTLTVPGSTGTVAVTGLGGTPAAVFFWGTNWLTEDTAVTTAHLGMFRGMAAPDYSNPGTILQHFSFMEPSGDAFNVGDGAPIVAMDTSGTATNLYIGVLDSFDADGFTIDFVQAASGGYKVVYAALMDVGQVGAYIGTDALVALGWKAGAALVQGHHGGGVDSASGDSTAQWYGGAAYPGTDNTAWMGAGLAALTYPASALAQYNIGIFDDSPDVDITQTGRFLGPYLSPQNVLAHPSGGSLEDFTFAPTSENYGMMVAWDDEDSATGRLTPDATTAGTETVSGLTFAPGLVIGYSISDEPQGLGTGGRGAVGFSVADSTGFQWTAICDGSSSQGSFQSFQRGFSSVVSGTSVLAGTIELTNDGFVLTTEEDDLSPAAWVWHAFGHPERIVAWIPHIYRRVMGT